jgi:AbrB family looped-hinge helix DNA binding protein
MGLFWSMPGSRDVKRIRNFAMRITSRGQVTIPADIRKRAGLGPNTEVDCVFDGQAVCLIPITVRAGKDRGARLVAHLRGRGAVAMTTEAIMALTRDG